MESTHATSRDGAAISECKFRGIEHGLCGCPNLLRAPAEGHPGMTENAGICIICSDTSRCVTNYRIKSYLSEEGCLDRRHRLLYRAMVAATHVTPKTGLVCANYQTTEKQFVVAYPLCR